MLSEYESPLVQNLMFELEMKRPSDGQYAAFNAFRLNYANRLRKINVVSDVILNDVNIEVLPIAGCSLAGGISFSLCGLPVYVNHFQNKDGEITEISRFGDIPSVIEALEAWQTRAGVDELEERFRI